MTAPLIDARGIVKTYHKNSNTIPVLRGIDLQLARGGFLCVMGASGSGKSTLMNIIGCLDRPSAGTFQLDGLDVIQSSDDQLSRLRSRFIGFVFQTFNLIPGLSVAENVELPFLYRSDQPTDIRQSVADAITRVGLDHRINHRPSELSGGEMQRVAIARALAIRPKLILADEPTGNLDSNNSQEIMQLFAQLHHQGSSIIMVTHNRDVAAYADTRMVISDGRIIHG
jgi:putative ABC transport system ATP-binding protein